MASIQERTTKDGEVKYRAVVRIRGQKTQIAYFNRKKAAKDWAKQTETDIQQGRHFKNAEAKNHTLTDAIDRYLEDVLPQYKDQAKPTIHLNFWKDKLGHVILSELTLAAIVEERDNLLRDGLHPGKKENRKMGPSTANRYTTSLSRLLSVCVRDWGWMEESPMRKLRKMKEPQGRVRFLSNEERRDLLEACKKSKNRFLYSAVALALNTGARRSEIWGLTWDQVDFDREDGPVLVLDKTKNSDIRVVPLTETAFNVLQELNRTERRLDTPYVFPAANVDSKPLDHRTSWENAVKEAGIKDFRWHDLRHSCASYLTMAGVPLVQVANILGHRTLQMTFRYSHLSPESNAEAMEKMNNRFFAEGA